MTSSLKHIKAFALFESQLEGNSAIAWIMTKNSAQSDYTLRKDGSIDVKGDVVIVEKGLTEIPIRFNKVTGSFNVYDNNLTSLKGCPIEVGKSFNCSENDLTSLEYAPRIVGGGFDCSFNYNLSSFEGCPEIIGGKFHCDKVAIPYEILENIEKSDGQEVCDMWKVWFNKGLEGPNKIGVFDK